nr:ribonuclease H-like domain-containing protein [Tanacetum cinerariifolium]
MNKLVKGNIVRGIHLKIFENDHTCVACQKGKQYKATLTDDFSRFSWVFFLATKALVTKSQNKTLYELLNGRTPRLDFMRPFGCPITILNTLDPLGKFEGKADEGFLVGYSVTSKAFKGIKLTKIQVHGNGYQQKDKNKAKMNKTEHEMEKRRKVKVKVNQKVNQVKVNSQRRSQYQRNVKWANTYPSNRLGQTSVIPKHKTLSLISRQSSTHCSSVFYLLAPRQSKVTPQTSTPQIHLGNPLYHHSSKEEYKNSRVEMQELREHSRLKAKIGKEVFDRHYILLPLWSSISSTFKSLDDKAADDKPKDDTGSKTVEEPVNKENQAYKDELDRIMGQEKEASNAADALRKEFKLG